MLIGSRALQGAMAALMVPQVLSFVQVEFPAAERARALAVYGMTFALGGVSGPLLGWRSWVMATRCRAAFS
jgi:MFS family permease